MFEGFLRTIMLGIFIVVIYSIWIPNTFYGLLKGKTPELLNITHSPKIRGAY